MKKLFLITGVFFLFGSMFAQIPDLYVFYRAPLSYQFPTKKVSDWATHIDVRYAEGETSQSMNSSENKTDLFNMHGPFSLKNLAANVEGVSSTGAKSVTYNRLYTGDNVANSFDGTVKIKGDFKTNQLDLTLKQNFKRGLYFQAHVPIREVKISNIDYSHSVTTAAEQTVIDNFLANDLYDILADNDYSYSFTANYSHHDVSDVLIAIGWQAYDTKSWGVIDSMRGYLQLGVIVPLSSRQPQDRVFAISTGYNNHWGVDMRLQSHATIFKRMCVGVSASASIFLKETYERRMTTTDTQNGWIVLEKGQAEVDPGTVWNIGGYIGAEKILGGLSAVIGYSYTKQEDTHLSVRDHDFLQTAQAADAYLSKDLIANCDSNLKGWYHHTVHFKAAYDFAEHYARFAPRFSVFYDIPIKGQYTWLAEMLGGTLGMQLGWSF